MRILITTQINDVHAAVVEAALLQRGHAVDLHYGADFAVQQYQSLRIGPRQPRRISCGDARRELGFDSADVFWLRRYMSGSTPEALHPSDRSFARRERLHVADGILQVCAPQAFWINPVPAATRARLKPVQVATAADLGLNVPETLFSNDPGRIRAFVREMETAVYKPCTSVAWRDGERYASVYTSPVTLEDLPGDEMLTACPGIYQRRVEKAYEVRATMFGGTCLALRLDPHSHPLAGDDWRRAQRLGLRSEAIELPPHVLEQAQALMQQLGLVFGCIDFIVTPQGDWVFLEVNEMGQFLWVEHLAPQIPMLDAFVRFVESADPAFRYRPGTEPLRLASILADGTVEQRMREEACHHVPPSSWFVHHESFAESAESAPAHH